MQPKVISLHFNGEEYTFRLKVNDKKVRNWITFKLVPAGDRFTHSYKLIDNDHATVVWNRLADHFYSSNNNLMLNDDLMNAVKEIITIEYQQSA